MSNASAKAREAGFVCLSASSLGDPRFSSIRKARRGEEEKFENIAFVISSTFDDVEPVQSSSEGEGDEYR